LNEKIIYLENHPDVISVRAREVYFKSYKGVKEKREIIRLNTKDK
jgi:hypothetical protein